MRRSPLTLAVCVLVALGLLAVPPGAEPLTVFAAASLADALTAAASEYEKEEGGKVVLSFGSSGALAKQIANGAPAALFASADRKWMDYLDERGLIEQASRASPISNQLVLIAPKTSAVSSAALKKGVDLLTLIGPKDRITVGDPDYAPAGVYAKQAFVWLGVWAQIEPRLARAEDVRAALALVDRGEAPLGVVYRTDALISPDVKTVGTFPPESHDPIVYPFALVKGHGSDEARAFLQFLESDKGLVIFEKYGFTRN